MCIQSKILSSCCTKFKVCTLIIFRCRKLPKALKEWQAIDDFNETCPLLEQMANKAMMARHWERIANTTSHTFDVENEGFLLRNIMEAPLLQFKEDIEVSVFCI